MKKIFSSLVIVFSLLACSSEEKQDNVGSVTDSGIIYESGIVETPVDLVDSGIAPIECNPGYNQICMDNELYQYYYGDEIMIYKLIGSEKDTIFKKIDIVLSSGTQLTNGNEGVFVLLIEDRLLEEKNLSDAELITNLVVQGFADITCSSTAFENDFFTCYENEVYFTVESNENLVVLEKLAQIGSIAVLEVEVVVYSDQLVTIKDISGGNNRYLIEHNFQVLEIKDLYTVFNKEEIIEISDRFEYLPIEVFN